jgi:hypothetical protein
MVEGTITPRGMYLKDLQKFEKDTSTSSLEEWLESEQLNDAFGDVYEDIQGRIDRHELSSTDSILDK